ncbi:MAG TPA: hypothetical protein ENI22_02550 [Candidatus Pacearchaeota archaeon]|nr:hypothetical protein [Candidatus Pacearchaeota archaeon]
MKLTEAAEKVLREDPRTRDTKYQWLFISKVLKEIGIKFYVDYYGSKLPSPDSMLVLRRTILNKKNRFPEDSKEILPSLEIQMRNAKNE